MNRKIFTLCAVSTASIFLLFFSDILVGQGTGTGGGGGTAQTALTPGIMGAVPTNRVINTTGPLTGGGALDQDRTFAFDGSITFNVTGATNFPANVVVTNGNQTISGIKTFTSDVTGNGLNSVTNFASGYFGSNSVWIGNFQLRSDANTNLFLGPTGNITIDGKNKRIGIGTATPAYDLHINSSETNQVLITTAAAGNCYVRINAAANQEAAIVLQRAGVDSWFLDRPANVDNLTFFYVSSAVTTWTTNSNFGVGTTSPSERLHVNGRSLFESNVTINATGSLTNFGNTVLSNATVNGVLSMGTNQISTIPRSFPFTMTSFPGGSSNFLTFAHETIPAGKTFYVRNIQSILSDGSVPATNQVIRVYNATGAATLVATNGNWLGEIAITNTLRWYARFENNSTTNINASGSIHGDFR